jgi:transcriptional regulator with XRE-family HTH domain
MKINEKEEARILRSQGVSLKGIANKLGVSKSTVSLWVRDIIIEESLTARLYANQYENGRKAAEKAKTLFSDARVLAREQGRIKAQEKDPLHLTGCMLYWCEGYKSRGSVQLVNTDPVLIKTFLKFLRESCGVIDENIKIKIYFYQDLRSKDEVVDFWLSLTSLTKDNIQSIVVKEGKTEKKRRREYGMCVIMVHSTKLINHIYGAIQEYSGEVNPEWNR